MNTLDDIAIENFREYLRIKSVHPNPDYDSCVKFLTKQASQLNLPVKVIRFIENKPIIIITWEGFEPNLPAILLNSHTDVVPVFENSWKHPPFEAVMEQNGDIYGRGTQDMKCVGIMYLEAIRRLKKQFKNFKRTIHLSFVPDEEISSIYGMQAFVNSNEFRQLNIGFSLDEGVVCPENIYPVFYGEKIQWQVNVHCAGIPSHGCEMNRDSPGQKLRYIINKFLEYRDKMMDKKGEGVLGASKVTSINLTKVNGGVQINVVPELFTASFDLRISVDENLQEFENMLQNWCKEAGDGVNLEFEQKQLDNSVSSIDETNEIWLAFKQATKKLNIKILPIICPGNTDSRFLRSVGVQAYGFTPINNTPLLLHSHNERINKNDFLNGIKIYSDIIPAIANA